MMKNVFPQGLKSVHRALQYELLTFEIHFILYNLVYKMTLLTFLLSVLPTVCLQYYCEFTG